MQKTVLSIMFLIAFLFGVIYMSFFVTPKHSKPITALYGYIDKFGDYVISPRFYGAEDFTEDLAAVQVDSLLGKWGYINAKGDFEIEPKYFRARPFSEGLALVKPSAKSPWGYIDYRAHWVLPARYQLGTSFHNGMASVLYNNKRFYVDRFGTPLKKQPPYGVTVFSEGLGEYSENSLVGFINPDGKVVVPARFLAAGPFSEGYAAVKLNTGLIERWGYADKTGQVEIPPEYGEAGKFGEGLAPVRGGGFIGLFEKWGYVDKTGKWVIEPQFDAALEYSEGLAPVAKKGKWGYIDKTGKFYIAAKFDWAQPFRGGLAVVGFERLPKGQASETR